MPYDAIHEAALIETAQLELDRAHRAALSMDGGEMRRGLELAVSALQEAQSGTPGLGGFIAELQQALVDLETGKLTEMALLIETVRKALA